MKPNEATFQKASGLNLYARTAHGESTLERLNMSDGGSLDRVRVKTDWTLASANMTDTNDYTLINSGGQYIEFIEIDSASNITDTTSRNILRPYGSDGRV